MRKRIGSLLLALALCLTLLPTALAAGGTWDGSIAAAFAGGTGTKSDPYQIADGAQLAYLASSVNGGEPYLGAYFVLTADIDLGNQNWTPIGIDSNAFAGTLDGKGHTISNISIGAESAPLESDVFGLFGETSGKISNLNLDGITIYGIAKNVPGYVTGLAGALVGFAGGSIENCHVTNLNMTMTMNTPSRGWTVAYWIGGLVGALDGEQSITECSASGTITENAGKGSIGGLIGVLGQAAKITYSHADVALKVKSDYYGGADVGGLIGMGIGNTDPKTVISNCYAAGNVTGGAYSGGFAGSLFGLNIKNCYATGDVTGAAGSMATFVGTDAPAGYAYGSVTNCYTTGMVGTAASRYAFAMQGGTPRSPISNCYFAEANSAAKSSYETAVPKTPEEMQAEEFKDALNAGDPANGWLFAAGRTPLCGAEPADYSAVDAALGKIPKDPTAYTDESVEALSAATEAVIRGKVVAKQAEVDAMAAAIEAAIGGLTRKAAPSGGAPVYWVSVPQTENGSVTASPRYAGQGVTVTVTVKPDSGYQLSALTAAIQNGGRLPLTDRGGGAYSFTMPAGNVEVKAAFAEAAEIVPFRDVPADHACYDAVRWAQEAGIALGAGDGLFGPNAPCTRAQVITFLWRAAGSPEPESAESFADVPAGSYCAKAIAWAAENGIALGVSSGLFHPDAVCTRAQGIAFVYRAIGRIVHTESGFADVPAGSYFAGAVSWAAAYGVTNGIGGGLFGPGRSCTRAQFIMFLYRAHLG